MGRIRGSKTAFGITATDLYCSKRISVFFQSLGLFQSGWNIVLCWLILAFGYIRESRCEVHSFNFFDILKRLKNEHKNANEKAGLKMRNDNQLCEKQLSLFNFFCSLKVTFQQWKVLKLRYSSKIYTVLAYIFFKTFSLCIIKSDLFIVRPAVCKRLHALKV